eukprot:CAMPEP_0118947022 /NCGR_PEP_ID=MMETSP1169-20130426/45240_1 /TAXON_ID=36882 /ORGANISM="Pyramimonas obovata, Strain CCMP722" /LENGTH=358 /DNA_ID=CAMNT_0006893145 /DNA_START=125 /DNA_END=1198 /DNA_ORIENTATION=-
MVSSREIISWVVVCLCLAVCAEAKLVLFNSNSGVTPPKKGIPVSSPNTVWLYTSIAADYDGATMLPHFVKHYLGLGVKPENFLVVVNHNPEKADPASEVDPVQNVVSVLDSYNITYRLWLDQYSSEKLMKIRYELLNKAAWNDWIIHADSDELHDYGVKSVVKYLGHAESEGVNEIKGTLVDRVSASGELTPISPYGDIFQQYPLKCQVIKNLVGSRDVKAMAYKAYWRTDRGNHQVLRAVRTVGYLSGSPGPGMESGRGVVDAEDLYSISPYARNPKAYLYFCQHNDIEEDGTLKLKLPPGVTCYQDAEKVPKGLLNRKSKSAIVYHFKWHEGVINSVKDRLKYYKGNETGQPRYDW